jgi:acyl-CoA reductase-like NAD-dependent aldehyde dehydrogenase
MTRDEAISKVKAAIADMEASGKPHTSEGMVITTNPDGTRDMQRGPVTTRRYDAEKAVAALETVCEVAKDYPDEAIEHGRLAFTAVAPVISTHKDRLVKVITAPHMKAYAEAKMGRAVPYPPAS